MACISDLVAVGIVEKDTNNDVLWVWSYPCLSSKHKTLVINKCGLENDINTSHEQHLVPFVYLHHDQSWFYLQLTDVNEEKNLSRVKHFIVVLQTRDFNPEKYNNLCRILSKSYKDKGSPAIMLQLYLSVLIKGVCAVEENNTFMAKEFENASSLSYIPAKDIVKIFGLKTILIYTALLLKKRIVVYHHRLDSLLWFVRALPSFMWHRQDWNLLYPYMQLTKPELSELLSLSSYVAGFRDASVEGKTELYDLFVNLPAIEITPAPHAKETFSMTKTHKEIALFMTTQAENAELNDKMFIKELANKTNELLRSLKSLLVKNDSGQEVLKLSSKSKVAPALESFLLNLASAEGYSLDLQSQLKKS